MRRDSDLHVELCGEHVVVAVFGLGERVAVHGARLVAALERACAAPAWPVAVAVPHRNHTVERRSSPLQRG